MKVIFRSDISNIFEVIFRHGCSPANTPGRLLLLDASGWKNFVYHKVQIASSTYTPLSDNTIEVVWMNKEY